MKVKNIKVMNLEGALRGMRNPLESWDKSDSYWLEGNLQLPSGETIWNYPYKFVVGEKDIALGQKLIKAGSDHRKFLRQILVSMDITATMSFWWDIDTYEVGRAKNSTSRMHKLTSKNYKPLTKEDLGWEHMTKWREDSLKHFNESIENLKKLSEKGYAIMSDEYQFTFNELIHDLPESYVFTRQWTGNFEILYKLYHARKNHKQKEIRDFCKVIETIEYADKFIII